MHRLHPTLAVFCLLPVVGCTPDQPEAPAPTPAAVETMVAAPVPPAAHAKIGADQVGTLSPVPAFSGGGADWHIEVHATGGMRHDVQLQRQGQTASGTLVYRPPEASVETDPEPAMSAADADAEAITLDGTLYASRGDTPLQVRIVDDACTDAAGKPHPKRIEVTVADTTLHGCGELAVY